MLISPIYFRLDIIMTYEELKIEADKLGYTLVKFKKAEKLLPCICGCNRRSTYYGSVYYADEDKYGERVTLECMRCGRKALSGKNRVEAVANWNKMIRDLTDGND